MYKIDTTKAPIFTSDTGETIVELVGPESNGSKGYSIAECTMIPGAESQAHYHPVVEETYCITNGSGYMMVNGEHLDIKAGDTIVIPATVSHQVVNSSASTLKFLVTCVPEWTPECSVFVK
jgi:mannose-6-phosphate isomerase-like protein (cupin superfamily)